MPLHEALQPVAVGLSSGVATEPLVLDKDLP